MTDAIADPLLADVYRDALLALLPEPLSIWEFAGEEVRVTRYRWNGEGWLISVVDETGKPITATSVGPSSRRTTRPRSRRPIRRRVTTAGCS